jgi:rod shape-determining protein MreD
VSRDRSSRPLPIIASIIVALMLTIAPLPDWLNHYRPDWVTLTLIYWSMHLPRSYGIGVAWLVGLVVDVAQGTLLAQHALAMSLVIYMTAKFHLQLRVFPVSQMAATVLALLSLYRFVLFWINGVAGISAPAVAYWGPIVTGALIWPLVALILGSLPYRRRASA